MLTDSSATAGVDEFTVTPSGGGASNALPLYVTPLATSISAYTSNANTDADTASVGGTGTSTPYSISARMIGGGSGTAIQVAQDINNPTGQPLRITRDFFDVHLVGSLSSSGSVAISDCTPGDDTLAWYNPTRTGAWQTLSGVTSSGGCLHATITGSYATFLHDSTASFPVPITAGMWIECTNAYSWTPSLGR